MDYCPHCGSCWLGEPIPAEIQEHYHGTHWRREIGIDGGQLGIYDGVVAYACPDCLECVPRNDSQWAQEMFAKFERATKTKTGLKKMLENR